MGRSLYEILRRPVRPNSQRRQRDDDYQGVEVALGHAQCRTSLIVCPRCRASEFNLLEATCRSCGETYSAPDGIIDFVGGRSDTALDVESYDQQKSVSFEKSVELFDALKRLAAGAIGDQVDTILEIGAGTGLLTLGMLNETEFERALITDISPRMLSICSRRFASLSKEKWSRCVFATYSGGEDIFGKRQFDLCIANSVLHHILEYARIFRSCYDALRSGGVAVFVEPGAVFHEALTLALAEAIVTLAARGEIPRELRIVAAWVEQTRLRLRCSLAELAQFEDKHLFRREEVAQEGRKAGFAAVSLTPVTFDPIGENAARNYLQELGVAPKSIGVLMPVYVEHARHAFSKVAAADASDMYLITLRT